VKELHTEEIVLVDVNGKAIGTALKLPSHNADTRLHLAFSCYVFNPLGEILVTKRAQAKKVWPGVWTNSVCGHPAPNENLLDAIKRRLNYELGMTAQNPQLIIDKYIYRTPPFKGVVEYEFCPIYAARTNSQPSTNPAEVETYKWLKWADYKKEIESDNGDLYSWWSKDQLKQLKDHHLMAKYFVPN